MNDSIKHIVNHFSEINGKIIQQSDSLLLNDSIFVANSDTVFSPFSGFVGLPISSGFSTESWIFILFLFSFLLLSFIVQKSDGILSENFKSFFSKSKLQNSIQFFRLQPFIFAFNVIILSFTLYFLLLSTEKSSLDFLLFLKFGLVFILFFAVKYLFFELIGFVFFDVRTTREYQKIYFTLLTFSAIFLFPFLLFYIYQPSLWINAINIVGLIFLIAFHTILISKLFLFFFVKRIALLYIFLYLCTLEILPLIVLIRVCENLI